MKHLLKNVSLDAKVEAKFKTLSETELKKVIGGDETVLEVADGGDAAKSDKPWKSGAYTSSSGCDDTRLCTYSCG